VLFTTGYNFVRIHKTLRVTPAATAGVTDKLRDVRNIVKVLLWRIGMLRARTTC